MNDVYEVDVHVRGNETDDVDAVDVADDDRIELEVKHELHFPIRPLTLRHASSHDRRTPSCLRASPASRAGGTLSGYPRSYR